MKYLLDTCVISDFVKGEKNTIHKIKETCPNLIGISSITIMEIQYGVSLNPKFGKIINPILHDFLTAITILDFNENDAIQAGRIRALLKQQGNPIGSYDFLLAATALNHQLILVTSNMKEFNKVPDLALENWRL